MQDNELRKIANDTSLTDRIGQVVRANGQVVEIQADEGHRPRVLDTVMLGERGNGCTTVARITHQGPNGTDHGVILSPTTPGLTAIGKGADVLSTDREVSIPLDHLAITTLIGLLKQGQEPSVMLETGIKVVDLFCPLPVGGLVGIVGDMQAGKMVLVEELIHRLDASDRPISILVFVQIGEETSIIRKTEYRRSESVSAIYLPVKDASLAALENVVADLDTVLVMSKSLADEGRYPAIEPVRSSSSRVVEPTAASPHADVVEAARAMLEDKSSAQRAALAGFLVQPFFVAEPFSGKPGETVARQVALQDLEGLVGTDA